MPPRVSARGADEFWSRSTSAAAVSAGGGSDVLPMLIAACPLTASAAACGRFSWRWSARGDVAGLSGARGRGAAHHQCRRDHLDEPSPRRRRRSCARSGRLSMRSERTGEPTPCDVSALNEETPCDPQPGGSPLKLKPSIPPSLPPCAPRTPPGLHPSHAEGGRSDRACAPVQPRPHRTPPG